MSWRNILILLLIIGALHILLIIGFSGGCRGCSDSKSEDTPSGETVAGENETAPDQPALPPPPPPPLRAKKVVPWVYGKNAALPQKLARQSDRARSGIIVEVDSRRVIWEKSSRQPVPVASLTKLMTVLLVAEELESNDNFKLTDMVEISKSAAGAESAGVAAGEVFTVNDLIASMMIRSTNGAAIQLAEKISGSEEKFIRKMNDRAAELGLQCASFNSASGLPQGRKKANSISTASDIIHLCEALMEFKTVMEFCDKSYAKLSNGKEVYTTNGLLKHPTKARPYWRKVPGLIGFKTGYTNAAGSCLAFGATRNGKTVLGCVTGFQSSADRERFCNDLIEWAYKTQVKK